MAGQLTERQRRFLAFFRDRRSRGFACATRAAALAGYAWPSKQGPRLLAMPHIRRVLDADIEALARQGETHLRLRIATARGPHELGRLLRMFDRFRRVAAGAGACRKN